MFISALLFGFFARQGGPLLSSVLPKAPAPGQVVVKVNGEAIRAEEIAPFLWDWRGQEVTQDFITYRLVLTEAKKSGIQVTIPEIQRAFDVQLKAMQANVPPGFDADAALRSQGFPKSRLYLKVHTDLLLDALVMRTFSPTAFVRVSTLAYRPATDSAQDLAAAIQRAQGAFDRLKAGSKWSDELQKSDDETGLKARNGELGWRTISAFPSSIRNDLKAARPGLITRPAQAAGAIQVFRVEELGNTAKGADLDELKSAYLTSGRQELIQRLRSKAKIEHIYKPK